MDTESKGKEEGKNKNDEAVSEKGSDEKQKKVKKEEEKKELIERIKGDAYLMGILEPVLSRFGVQEEVTSQ